MPDEPIHKREAFKAGWEMNSTAGAEDEWEEAYSYWSGEGDPGLMIAPPSSSILTVTLDRKLGGIGAAYDPPGPQRAYTYEHQPHNGPAYMLGCALSAASHKGGGDAIDAGLSLLKALQARGFGVFEMDPANLSPETSLRGSR